MNTDEKLASVLRTLRHTSAALRTVSMALNTAAVDLAQVLRLLDVEIGRPPRDSVGAVLAGADDDEVFDA